VRCDDDHRMSLSRRRYEEVCGRGRAAFFPGIPFHSRCPIFSAMLRVPTLPTGFIAPCLPTKAHTLPSGGQWLHEIKHDGFRIIARKDGARVRLFSRPERT
jgi:hypothetical protein